MTPVAIPAHNPGPMTGEGNTTWWIPGRVPVLVDAGTGDERHLEAVGRRSSATGTFHVVLTHAHGDHMSGAPAIAARWPHATFAKIPWPERDVRYDVTCAPIAHGDVIAAGDGDLEVVHTPGHSPDHACLWQAGSRTLFCGDLLIEGQTVVIPATRGGNLADYLRSLERVVALAPTRAFPAHGPVIERPVELARSYLRHRRRRERQVVEALAAGDGTAAAIARRIYEHLSGDMLRVAEDGVLAHLLKLEDEGRVRRSDGGGPTADAVFVAVESTAE